MNKKAECLSTKACVWIAICEKKSTMVPVLVISCITIFACICTGVFMLISKMRKKRQIGGYSLMESDLFKTKGSRMVVSIPIRGEEMELQLIEEIGRGAFGNVWKASAIESDMIFAVKILKGSVADGFVESKKEAMLMEQLDTQFVAAVYGCACTEKTMAIAMEYFEMGSLQKVLQADKLPSNCRVPMLLDIAKAMEYLHDMAIIHRDLKPDNVLVCSLDLNVHPMAKFVFFSFLFIEIIGGENDRHF